MKHHDKILQFDIVSHTWTQIGRMKYKRWNHAVSVVRSKDIDYCGDEPPSTLTPPTTTTTSTTTTSTTTPVPTTTTTFNPDDFSVYHSMSIKLDFNSNPHSRYHCDWWLW